MKYLSFIIGLLLLATLFSFVLTQLNKDETKHEYGIAFPLEESESRLPPLSSVVQLEVDAAKASLTGVKDSEAATTTTETIATSSKTTEASAGAENTAADMIKSVPSGDSEISVLSGESGDGGSSIIIESSSSSVSDSSSNDTDSDGSKDSKDSSEESDQPVGSTNPKLVFIERLMGLNFQRAPSGGFSSFLEMRSENSDASTEEKNNNKTEGNSQTGAASSDDNDGSKGDSSLPELPWGNTIESLRSRWESRIRKFTFPFQNSYSVVLRASGMASDPRDASESKDSVSMDSADSSSSSSDNSDSTGDKTAIIKPVDVPDRSSESSSDQSSSFSGPKFFFQTSSGPLGQPQSMTSDGHQSGSSSQANQLLRMAALSMMSKLFTALRNQAVYSNPKLDSGAASRFGSTLENSHHVHPNALSALDNTDGLELDDDEEENDIDLERGSATSAAEGMPVPIIMARPNRMAGSMDSPSSYGYGNDNSQSPVRTSVMFGRPSTAAHQGPIMMTQRIFSSSSGISGPSNGPVSPLAAILAAAAARQRRMESMQHEQPQSQQPQRLILLISHRSPSAPAASSSRDEMLPMSPVSVASRLQMFGRDERLDYPQSSSSASQPMFHYAPLSPPSSPIYYHFSPQSSQSSASEIRPSMLVQSIAASLQAQSQPQQPQVVEVPVPVYLPMMMRMGRHSSSMASSGPSASSAAVGQAPIRRIVSLPRAMAMMPAEPRGVPVEMPMSSSSGTGGSGGHVALLMVQHATPNDQVDSHSESLAMPHYVEPNAPLSFSPSSSSEASSEPASGFVRIFLRPKLSPAVSAMPSRIAFHRRLDDSAEEDMPASAHQLISSPLIAAAAHHAAAEAAAAAVASQQQQPSSPVLDNARLRQWRDYSQFVRSAPAPMVSSSSNSGAPHGTPVAHLLIATAPSHSSRSVDHETAASEDQQHQPMHFGTPQQSPFFFHAHAHHQQPAENSQQLPHPLMMAAAAAQQHQQSNSQAVAGAHHHNHAAAFFILAEPNGSGAQSEAANGSGTDA